MLFGPAIKGLLPVYRGSGVWLGLSAAGGVSRGCAGLLGLSADLSPYTGKSAALPRRTPIADIERDELRPREH